MTRIPFFLILSALLCFSLSAVGAEKFLIDDGHPKAEIVVGAKPTRTQRLAARELQTYFQKITGVELPIREKPGGEAVALFVGRSKATDKLGLTPCGLKYGAYRLVSGEDWLAFLGDDTEFTPIEPWPRGYQDIRSGNMQREWNAITGHQWGYMHSQLHKHYSGPNALFGTPDQRDVDEDGNVNVWTYDERGSFNAVCGFLRDLGVRWYMPGDIGEIVPKRASISLPEIDKTVTPDFPMRILNFRASVYGRDVMMWGFRLGVRQPYGRQAAHGLHGMTDNESTLTHHPEWFALYGGKRHNDPNVKNNQLCYSNEELFREAVEFARVQFDHFDMDVVSIMPPDGYTAICQCDQCAGKESADLGQRGKLSNYVWDFVNRVAKEVRKTHPDKRISNCAYGVYTEPPSNIDKLEPNVQVIIVGGRRPTSADRKNLQRLRREWQEKTDSPLEIFENYPFTARGFYLPAYMPAVLGESINETKGQSRGEDIWLSMDFSDDAIGYNHFLIYFTARMYWGGTDQDASRLFDEYVTKFYGPAAPAMGEFFSYCETNWREMEKDETKASRALELFTTAKVASSSDSIYGQRIQLIDNYLNGLRNKARQLAQKRGPVPTLRLVSGADRRGKIVVDGKLDDGPWVKIPTSSTGRLRELQTGRQATFGTSFMAEWIGNDLYFGIRCEEKPGEALNVTSQKDGDQALWYGDAVEIELATNSHSYYQLAINPAGALVELDRGAPKNQWFNWSSGAEVATHIADDYWSVEIRLPITDDANDPLHQVVGRKPTQSLPWFVNVCRQRIRENGAEFSAFSPTGSGEFHVPMKFAHFFAGNSHRFDSDPTVTGYVIERQAAENLMRSRKWKDALEAYLQLAQCEKATEFQSSDALRFAAVCAASLDNFEQAEKFAAEISIEAVQKTTRMQILSAQRKWSEIARQFGSEPIEAWPFWEIAAGSFDLGRAYNFLKQGAEAERDLQRALTYEPDSRKKLMTRTMLADVYEQLLESESKAVALYRENLAGKTSIGGADEFRSVQRLAAIMTKQKRFNEALDTFQVVDFENQRGYWLYEMLLAKAETLSAAARMAEAEKLYQRVIEDSAASAGQKKRAQERL
jgi:tetratricopeptide (TPR) repeat protein